MHGRNISRAEQGVRGSRASSAEHKAHRKSQKAMSPSGRDKGTGQKGIPGCRGKREVPAAPARLWHTVIDGGHARCTKERNCEEKEEPANTAKTVLGSGARQKLGALT